jgi:alpha-tubulin suppressor-like RCC1 family protein
MNPISKSQTPNGDRRGAIVNVPRTAFKLLAILLSAFIPTVYGADIVSVWGGARGTVVLKSDGTVWTWGANFNGKLGIGQAQSNYVRALVPMEVHDFWNTGYLHSISAVMGGEIHNVALKSDGTVWSWGWNAFGQLGDGTTNDAYSPIQTGLTAVPPLTSVVKLGGRPYFTLAVKSDGTIWAWGMNQFGQVGNGTINPLGTLQVTVPVEVSNSWSGGPLNHPTHVTCGYQFGAALAPNGNVWTWGSGSHGELGNGIAGGTYSLPAQVPGLTNIAAISAGWFHILALQSNGVVWAWGNNSNGELGDGAPVNRASPVRVMNVSNIVAVSGGDGHSSALAADGTIWKWGLNDLGELGNGSTNTIPNPVPARILVDQSGTGFSNIVLMAARDYHNIAVKSDGSVWMWGANDQGQCGVGNTNSVWRPVQVVGLGARVGLPLNAALDVQSRYADLSWSSSTGAYFSVQYAANLGSGFATLTPSNILATPPTNFLAIPLTNSGGYFRLKF